MRFSPDDVEMLQGFLEEAPDYLEGLEEKILKLESDYSEENIDDLFRSFHSLKGMAGFVNLSSVVDVCHELEDILKALKKNEIKFSDKITDILLEGTDVVKEVVKNIASSLEGYEEGEIEIEVEGLGEDDIKKMAEAIMSGKEEVSSEEEESKDQEGFLQGEKGEEFLTTFIEELEDKLGDIEKYMLEFEKKQTKELINDLMRLFHSIKGDTRLILSMSPNKDMEAPLKAIEKISHAIEEIFQRAQNEKIKISDEFIDLIFEGTDLIKAIFLSLKEGGEVPEYDEYFSKLEEKLGYESEAKKEIQDVEAGGSNAAFWALYNIVEQWLDYFKVFSSSPDDAKASQFRRMTEIVKGGFERLEEEEKKATVDKILTLLDKKDPEPLKKLVEEIEKWAKEKKEKTEKKEKEVKKQAIQKKKPSSTSAHHEIVSHTVRVERAKLDRLMNLVGELITLKNAFSDIAEDMDNTSRLKDIIGKMERLANGFQSTVMSMRMVSVAELFNRYQRTIRDLSKSLKKQIKLHIEGEDTELDRTVIEKLVDPMTHIIRNAVDHGVESPDIREKSGKPKEGNIWMRAYYKGSYAFIEVEDDGKGIDPNAIRSKGIERGLFTPDEALKIPDDEVISYIFEPGFSTKEAVSNISGRGVGMDVVKTNIEGMGGKVFIESEVGKGTKIVLRIPLSLSIMLGLMFEVNQHKYIFPVEYIQETIKVKKDAIHDYAGVLLVDVRGEMLPLIPLENVLEETGIDVREKEYDFDLIPLIIVKEGKETVAFVVDKFLGENEFLIKSVPEYLKIGGIISGATFLGNGEVVLILDPSRLVV